MNNAGNNRILDAAALDDIFNADHTIAAGKTLQILGPVTLSAPLRINGGAFVLASVKPGNETAFGANLDWDSGTLQFTNSGLTVGNSGLFGHTLLMGADQTLLVSQTLTIDAGAELVVAGGLTTGGLTNNGNLVALHTTINGAVVNNNAVTVVGTVDFNGLVSGPGNFFGPGTANFNGGMAPGASAAQINFEGNVNLSSSNILQMELGGATPGTQFDRLHIDGHLSLAGTLQVSLLNNFFPTAGNIFDLLDWGTQDGQFSSVQLPNLGGALGWNTSQLYTSGQLSVVNVNFLQGDWNRDGQVTEADILSMLSALTDLSSYESTNSLSPTQLAAIGDFDGSGTVTNRDLQGLLDLVASQSGAGSVAAVPEPNALILLALAFPAVAGIALRRRHQ